MHRLCACSWTCYGLKVTGSVRVLALYNNPPALVGSVNCSLRGMAMWQQQCYWQFDFFVETLCCFLFVFLLCFFLPFLLQILPRGGPCVSTHHGLTVKGITILIITLLMRTVRMLLNKVLLWLVMAKLGWYEWWVIILAHNYHG